MWSFSSNSTRRSIRRGFASLMLATGAALLLANAASRAQEADHPAGADGAGAVVVATLSGPVGPASAEFLQNTLDDLKPHATRALVLELDTPGGLVSSMRTMIQTILEADVPVLSFVSPQGSRAASAGTCLLYPGHVAAMSPGTNLGAATPVSIGGGASAMESKVINDLVAYIRSAAELRGRNAEWAETPVRGAESLTASAALERDVTDLIANDVTELLQQVSGRVVEVRGTQTTLDLAGAKLVQVETSWRIALLQIITNPNVALLLMALGLYGIVFGFIKPGALVPVTVGAISLLLGLYASLVLLLGLYTFSVLPLNLLGAAALLLGLALMIAEVFLPSFGVLGIGGVVAFVLGATALFDTDSPEFDVALPVVAGIAIGCLLLTLVIAQVAVRSMRRKGVSGEQGLTGLHATVVDWSGKRGHVFVDGERWQAMSEQELITPGTVKITALSGNTLHVEAIESTEALQARE